MGSLRRVLWPCFSFLALAPLPSRPVSALAVGQGSNCPNT